MRKPEVELASSLDRLVQAGLLFRQGVAPSASYLFKHALVQDAAYGTLLREPRRALHARIAEALEGTFGDIAETQPELLARHCTEAGLIEKAAALWSKAGHRSLDRSALIEASEQLARALDQIAALPSTRDLRREEITLQISFANALMHTKGFAASETTAALARAQSLIEQAEALGEPPEDPLPWFSVLYGFWVANQVAFDGVALSELAARILTLAEKQAETAPLMIGHRLMGDSLVSMGNVVQGRVHLDRALALYDSARHRPLATRFGHDSRVAILSYRAWALWMLGYPDAALADIGQAVGFAIDIDHPATLMFALAAALVPQLLCRDYAKAKEMSDRFVALADEKRAAMWKAYSVMFRGSLLALTGSGADAVHTITAGIAAHRSTGSTIELPWFLSCLAQAHANLGRLDDAWIAINEAVTAAETTQEAWCEAECHRIAGAIALMSPEPNATRAQACFDRALAIARAQHTKSWELRAAMSMARLWRDQGKREEARNLLAPVYSCFTQGLDTLDLKEARLCSMNCAPDKDF